MPELLKRNLTVDVSNRRYVGDTTFRWYDPVLARLFSATTILPVRGEPRGGVIVAQGTSFQRWPLSSSAICPRAFVSSPAISRARFTTATDSAAGITTAPDESA